VTVKLAYYPPYHSKYNPVERVFGVLERYWNGTPLRRVADALFMASGMTYKGVHPTSQLISADYPKGVRQTKKEMKPYEACLDRLVNLKKWFITILPEKAKAVVKAIQGKA
jgi:hypothetical protein